MPGVDPTLLPLLGCVDCDALFPSISMAEDHTRDLTPSQEDLDAGVDAHDSFYITNLEVQING